VTWYLGQSWLMLLLSFLLGALVGWWWWRRQWSKVRFTESEAISQVTSRHSEHLAAKDAEIARLRGLLSKAGDAGAAGSAAVAGTAVAASTVAADTAPVAAADVTADANGTVAAADAAAADAAGTATAEAPSLVDLDAVDSPSVDLGEAPNSIDLTGVEAPSVDVTREGTGGLTVPTQGGAPDAATSGQDVAEAAAEARAADASAMSHETAALAETAAGTAVAAGTAASTDAAAEAAGTTTPAAAAGGEQGVIDLGHGEAQDESGHDLERIEGIGPRIAGALRASGIHTFGALADSDVATLQAALEAAGLRFAPSLPTWARQARLLADGDEAGFLALTEQLVAGRDTGRRP